MGFLESLRLALEGLRANKMRAALTMLGIIIGIAAVIGILTVGETKFKTLPDNEDSQMFICHTKAS